MCLTSLSLVLVSLNVALVSCNLATNEINRTCCVVDTVHCARDGKAVMVLTSKMEDCQTVVVASNPLVETDELASDPITDTTNALSSSSDLILVLASSSLSQGLEWVVACLVNKKHGWLSKNMIWLFYGQFNMYNISIFLMTIYNGAYIFI